MAEASVEEERVPCIEANSRLSSGFAPVSVVIPATNHLMVLLGIDPESTHLDRDGDRPVGCRMCAES